MATTDEIGERLSHVRLLAMDVDGVLTDGTIEFTADGDETKRFHIADGLGIKLALHAGLLVAWISGRKSSAVARRADELGVTRLIAGASNKSQALAELIGGHALSQRNVAYIGDDLNDLPAYSVVGVKFAPSSAVTEIKAVADFVTQREGGRGAVREVCDMILKAQGKWNDAVSAYLGTLLRNDDSRE